MLRCALDAAVSESQSQTSQACFSSQRKARVFEFDVEEMPIQSQEAL